MKRSLRHVRMMIAISACFGCTRPGVSPTWMSPLGVLMGPPSWVGWEGNRVRQRLEGRRQGRAVPTRACRRSRLAH
ncbi:MAG: hypothetical protein JW751_17905, partial [Polyangiaceae bacterium]|nr:hypothetical protein [Polyangiaceae bacterium]